MTDSSRGSAAWLRLGALAILLPFLVAVSGPVPGVPMDLAIDYHERAFDEELGMRVTEAVAPI